MPDIRRLDASVAVAPQLDPAEMDAVAAAGFRTVVNNRPDGEADGQPTGAAVRAAAEAAGLRYVAIPIDHRGFDRSQIGAMRDALEGTDGPVLAFCRSGTRSTNLWALARASAGDDPDALIETAAAAGYDLGGLRPVLETLRP